jgi:hypothetical protein
VWVTVILGWAASQARVAREVWLEGDARVLAGSCLHGGLLIQADQALMTALSGLD